jgi:predicted transcriptional regulator
MNGNTLTIELPPELAAQLAALPDDERNRFAVAALSAALSDPDMGIADAWWEGLTDEEQAEERRIVAESSAAGDAGRVSPAEDVYARLRARYAHLAPQAEAA